MLLAVWMLKTTLRLAGTRVPLADGMLGAFQLRPPSATGLSFLDGGRAANTVQGVREVGPLGVYSVSAQDGVDNLWIRAPQHSLDLEARLSIDRLREQPFRGFLRRESGRMLMSVESWSLSISYVEVALKRFSRHLESLLCYPVVLFDAGLGPIHMSVLFVAEMC